MSTFKKAKVVMLPSNQKTNGMVCKDITGQDKMINIKSDGVMEHEDYIGHHFYIISDDKIEEGDYYIIDGIPELLKNNGLKFIDDYCKKVIATTNTSLYTHQKETVSLPERVFYLPQPSQQFIQKFVEEYNKGREIKEVLVEYKEY